MSKVVVSGGFDPMHIGHLRMFEQAKKLGSELIVILNSDNFLKEKKGYVFMPFEERKELILGLECVDRVVESVDIDNTVCKTIEDLARKKEIDIFANGGDRKNKNDIPEYEICIKNNIEIIFDIGGEKIQSSSDLTKPFINYSEIRPWGSFENLEDHKGYKVKRLQVNPGAKLSVQFHHNRSEDWVIVKGKAKILIGKKEYEGRKGSHFKIQKKEVHCIENISKDLLVIIEVQIGANLSEDDIIRLEDIYGRS